MQIVVDSERWASGSVHSEVVVDSVMPFVEPIVAAAGAATTLPVAVEQVVATLDWSVVPEDH